MSYILSVMEMYFFATKSLLAISAHTINVLLEYKSDVTVTSGVLGVGLQNRVIRCVFH